MKIIIILILFVIFLGSCSNPKEEKVKFLSNIEKYQDMRYSYFDMIEIGDKDFYLARFRELKDNVAELKTPKDYPVAEKIKNLLNEAINFDISFIEYLMKESATPYSSDAIKELSKIGIAHMKATSLENGIKIKQLIYDEQTRLSIEN